MALVIGPGQGCKTDTDCPQGYVCTSDGQCVKGMGYSGYLGECGPYKPCPAGQVCRNGKCVEETLKPTGGAECSTDADCNTKRGAAKTGYHWECQNGTCVEVADEGEPPGPKPPDGGGEWGAGIITKPDYPFPMTGVRPTLSPADEALHGEIPDWIRNMYNTAGLTPEEKARLETSLTEPIKQSYQGMKREMMGELAHRGTVEGGLGERALSELYQGQLGDITKTKGDVETAALLREYSEKLQAANLADQYIKGQQNFALGDSSIQLQANQLALNQALGETGTKLNILGLSQEFQLAMYQSGVSQSQWEDSISLAIGGQYNQLLTLLTQLFNTVSGGYYS